MCVCVCVCAFEAVGMNVVKWVVASGVGTLDFTSNTAVLCFCEHVQVGKIRPIVRHHFHTMIKGLLSFKLSLALFYLIA